MSIAEQIATIAENVDKVRQSGYKTGYEIGWNDGEVYGYQNGYNDGKAAGGGAEPIMKKLTVTKNGKYTAADEGVSGYSTVEVSIADPWWDASQENGERTDYYYAFSGHLWTDDTFKPKYTVKPTNANYMFSNSLMTDVSGVKIDFSRLTGNSVGTRVFDASQITKVGTVDLSGATGTFNTFFGFYTEGTSKLETIELLKIPESEVKIFGSNFFQNCSELQNIRIEGKISSSVNFQWSAKLSVASMKSVILALVRLSGDDAGTQTLTFSKECWANLELENDIPVGEENQPLASSWRAYVEDYLGWGV